MLSRRHPDTNIKSSVVLGTNRKPVSPTEELKSMFLAPKDFKNEID